VDEHFELHGKKAGKFYELHAHRDGKLVRARPMDATDSKWGPLFADTQGTGHFNASLGAISVDFLLHW